MKRELIQIDFGLQSGAKYEFGISSDLYWNGKEIVLLIETKVESI